MRVNVSESRPRWRPSRNIGRHSTGISAIIARGLHCFRGISQNDEKDDGDSALLRVARGVSAAVRGVKEPQQLANVNGIIWK